VAILSTQSLIGVSFCSGSLLSPSQLLTSLNVINLDLMLLSNVTETFRLVITLVDTRRAWKKKPRTLAQLSSAIKLCSLALCFNLQIASSLTLNFVTTLACYSSLVWCLFLPPNRCHLIFHFVCAFNNGVTIRILWCHDETESLLWARTQGCAARHTLVLGLLVMIHYETTADVLFLVTVFLGYLHISYLDIPISDLM
jgi:hypothetical protein